MDYQLPPTGPGEYPPPQDPNYAGQQGYPGGPGGQQGYPQQDPYYAQQQPPGGYPPPQGSYPPPYGGDPYGGGPYMPPGSGYPGKGKATASMVLGIISCALIFLSWIGYGFGVVITFVLALIGLILGISARKSIPSGMPGAGMATAGFVLNLIALILCAVVFVGCLMCIGSLGFITRSLF